MSVPDWFKNWISPAGFLVVFGGIVWGIQLNWGYVQNTTDIATNKENIESVSNAMEEVIFVSRETALLVKQMQENDKEIHATIKEHNKEAEKWKQRIIRLEERGNGWHGGRGYGNVP